MHERKRFLKFSENTSVDLDINLDGRFLSQYDYHTMKPEADMDALHEFADWRAKTDALREKLLVRQHALREELSTVEQALNQLGVGDGVTAPGSTGPTPPTPNAAGARSLGEAIRIILAGGPLTSPQIAEKLAAHGHKVASTTVHTVLSRLVKSEDVQVHGERGSYRYSLPGRRAK